MESLAAALLAGCLLGAAAVYVWLRRPGPTVRSIERNLVEAVGNGLDGVALFDANGRLSACNERYKSLLSPIAHLIRPGVPFSELVEALAFAEGHGPGWVASIQASQDGNPVEEQFRGNQWITVSVHTTANGGRLRILRDVTRRKQAQLALENTAVWLKGVMDAVVDGIVTIDENAIVLSFNPAAQRLFGYGAAEVVGRNVNMLMPEPHHGRHDGYVKAYRDTGIRNVIGTVREVEALRKDGTTFPIELSVTEMNDGQMRTFIGVIHDITKRKQAERALMRGEELARLQASRLQAIMDNMAQGIAVFGDDDTLMALNQAAFRLLGLPESEIRPGTVDISLFVALLSATDVPFGQDALAMTDGLSESLRARAIVTFEHRLADGTVMEVRSSTMPDGGLILSFTDVTERKQTEHTLRVARDEAERGNRAKNTFLANISHELRTPLNAIIGFSEMMKHGIFGPVEPASYAGYVDDIHSSGMHLLELINDILDMSKAEAGMTELHEAPVDVADIIRSSARMMARRAQKAGVSITEEIPSRLPLLLADERRLRQIVLNLLSNAVKFSDNGGCVKMSAAVSDDGFTIAVSDDGIGMSPEDLIRVMEPFVQADNRLSRKYEGSGLGLPLTKLLVEAHGGTMEMDSAPGEGTVARACFPAARILNDMERNA